MALYWTTDFSHKKASKIIFKDDLSIQNMKPNLSVLKAAGVTSMMNPAAKPLQRTSP